MNTSQRSRAAELYPFLYPPAAVDSVTVLAELSRSAQEKVAEVAALRQQVIEASSERLIECALSMAAALRHGGRLFTFGNGGSSSDAQQVALSFLHPPYGQGVPALSLSMDGALVTALGNDAGFEVIFARQLAAFGRPPDIALGLSTSGGSANVLRAFTEAKRIGMLTIGLAGYNGGAMAQLDAIDYLFVVPSSSVHRIQETQTTLYHLLWELTQTAMAARTDG
jgi:D-sedoheptulose 7-phosphate isomerase